MFTKWQTEASVYTFDMVLKNKFKFNDHSFSHLTVTIWLDSMSRGQKSSHAQFLFICGQCVHHFK